MSATDMTGEEMFESFTGYDEIAVAKAFGLEVGSLANEKPTMFLRCMVFVHLRRQGKTDVEAKDVVMNMSLKECNGYFAENEEVDEEAPVTVPGEGVGLLV